MQTTTIQTECGQLVVHHYDIPLVSEHIWHKWILLHQFTFVNPDEFTDHLATLVPVATTIERVCIHFDVMPYSIERMDCTAKVELDFDEFASVQNAMKLFWAHQGKKQITFQQALQMHDAW